MFKRNTANHENRPNLLIISQSKEKLANFPHLHLGLIVPFFKSLMFNFNTIITSNVDNCISLVEKSNPDLILVDSGHERAPNELPDAISLKSKAGGCALAFYTAMDAHCSRISENVSYLNKLDPDVIFSHDFLGMTYPEHLSRKHIFILNTYDDDIFYDHKKNKEILCGFYGDGFFSRMAYPWRRKIASKVISQFPSYHLPRPVGLKDHGITGQAYAEIISRTKVCFGCGGVKDLPVRKLFEIPAAGSLLMLPDTENMKLIGFKDKENCIFVDEENVLPSIRYIIDNPQEYERIRTSGLDFVKSNHVWSKRDHVYKWYLLFMKLNKEQQVIQNGLLNDLCISNLASDQQQASSNSIYKWLEKASICLKSRDFECALEYYETCLEHIEHIPEAVYGVAICKLILQKEDDDRVKKYFRLYFNRLEFSSNLITKTLFEHYAGTIKVSPDSLILLLKAYNKQAAFFRFSLVE